MASKNRTAALRKKAGMRTARITAKQRTARKKNIAVARSFKKKGVAKTASGKKVHAKVIANNILECCRVGLQPLQIFCYDGFAFSV